MLHQYLSNRSSLVVKAALAAAACVAFAAAHARASLVVYEPYNYGLAQGTTMTGVTTNAVGLTGAYTDTNVINSPNDVSVNDVTYNTSSMHFGDLQTQGGSITSNPNGGKPIFSIGLSSSDLSAFSSGTIYGSFVLSTNANQLGTNGGGSGYVDGMLFGTSTSDDNSSIINISPISWGQNYGQIRVGSVAAAGTGTQLAINTPYLELFQISININTSAINASSWTLSASQFANFQGNLTAANLDSASTGTGSNQITEEAFASGTDSGILSSLETITNMSLFSFGSTGTYDEIRMSNASLAETAPVPEPATLGLFAVGAAGLLLLLKRRKAV